MKNRKSYSRCPALLAVLTVCSTVLFLFSSCGSGNGKPSSVGSDDPADTYRGYLSEIRRLDHLTAKELAGHLKRWQTVKDSVFARLRRDTLGLPGSDACKVCEGIHDSLRIEFSRLALSGPRTYGELLMLKERLSPYAADEELRRALKRQEKTSLRIGATKSIGDYILLPQIIRFLKEPDNELFFTVDNTAHLLAQLEGGELDFVVLEGIFDKSRYESFLLRNEPYIGICAKDHPFSGCEVPMDELFSERLILREPGSGTRKILERELMQCGYTIEAFRANVCISSFKLIRHLVSEGCGVSFLYEAVVKNDAQFGHFSCPPLTGVHELNVVCLKNTNVPALARRFLDL